MQILSPELSTGFTCSTLIEEGGYFPSFPDDISAIVDEWNANIKDDALLVSTREMNLEDKGSYVFILRLFIFALIMQP